ncbi:hypothetical protein MTR67_038564 [Solanum verrucosum]|uniref:Uncharacterized protein n=1 Tax=Solanum verrucosum TaxID=315347 RepID=A0AAF0UH24_SOLVR|nr:hypothetical protein MTR67_038564 [Solanum verrucosum]
MAKQEAKARKPFRGVNKVEALIRRNRILLVCTSSELAVRRSGKAPEGTVPSPSPGRHAVTPIKNNISDCGSSQIEDVIDLTGKLYPNSVKHVGVRPTHENDERLNVKLSENKLCKVIKKEKKT